MFLGDRIVLSSSRTNQSQLVSSIVASRGSAHALYTTICGFWGKVTIPRKSPLLEFVGRDAQTCLTLQDSAVYEIVPELVRAFSVHHGLPEGMARVRNGKS